MSEQTLDDAALAALRETAEAALKPSTLADLEENPTYFTTEESVFHAAANPTTVLQLLDALDAARALLRDAKYVIETTARGLGLSVDGRIISTTALLAEIDAALGEQC
jgi:hypothetical protein